MVLLSRQDAIALGKKHYFTGTPCSKGHISKRTVGDYNCCECKKEWHEKNAERVRKSRREYNKRNPEKCKRYLEENKQQIMEYRQKWREEHREESLQRTLQWQKDNPHRVNEISAKRRAAKLHRTPPWSEEDKIKFLYEKCVKLSELWGITLTVDHVIPLQGENVSGLHCWQNLQLLEKSDNISKGNKFTDEGC